MSEPPKQDVIELDLSDHVVILGAGSWGTALAHLIGGSGRHVTLWDRKSELAEQIRANHINSSYLPNVTLPPSVTAVGRMKEAFTAHTRWVIVSVSSGGVRQVASELGDCLTSDCAVVSATKGLEADTGMTTSEVLAMILQDAAYAGIAALSGPNLAQEVVRRVPTVAVSASESGAVARGVQQLLMTPGSFRVYTHNDVKGVEFAGALKNVLAIGAGLSDGLGFGDNTKAALLTRGLMEMTQLGLAAGARPLTFLGIAGVGDMMATSAGKLSRNYRVGLGLAQKKPLADILAEIGQAAEGVPTSKAALLLSKRYQTETPLFDVLHDVIHHGKSPSSAVDELMSRPAKDEYS